MPELPAEAVQAAAEALRTKQWGRLAWSAHGSHKFHFDCEICHGNLAAIAEVVLEAAAPFLTGVGSPAACPSVAPESTESEPGPSVAPIYPPGPAKPAETLTALREEGGRLRAVLARVREACLRVTSRQVRDDGDVGEQDHAMRVLKLLDGAGSVPGEHTGRGND